MPKHAIMSLFYFPGWVIMKAGVMIMYRLQDLMMMFDVPERTIRRHIRIGILNGVKIGGTWRFTEDDIKNYLSNSYIRESTRKRFLERVNEFLYGLSANKSDIFVSVNKHLDDQAQIERLTNFVNTFENTFFFDASSAGKDYVISFIGNKKDAIRLLDYLGDEND